MTQTGTSTPVIRSCDSRNAARISSGVTGRDGRLPPFAFDLIDYPMQVGIAIGARTERRY